jgi:hypothetical protein
MKRNLTTRLLTLLVAFLLTFPTLVFCQGSISGTITFTGTLPKETSYKHSISPEACGRQAPLDRLILGKNKGVQYTLLYLKNPPAGSTIGMKPAVIDQKHCHYTPHMSIAPKGSSLEMVNSDAILHTSHGYLYSGMERSTIFNIAQPIEGQRTQQPLRKAGMVEIECDAGHVWMSSWVWVTPSPYAVITNENGEFTMSNIPPGTYTLIMWHEGWKMKDTDEGERPKFSDPIAQEREVTIIDGKITTANFELR